MPLPMSLRVPITLKLPQTHAYTSLYLYTPACTQTSRNRDIYKYISEEQRLAYKTVFLIKAEMPTDPQAHEGNLSSTYRVHPL